MWTDAAIETLRRMALEGKSASSIAMALGAPSRNAVIGKANRIGVKLTGHIHCVAPRASRPSTERPAETRDRPHRRSSMEASRCSRCPARAKAGMGLRPGPGRGDVEGRARGDRRKQLPMADWRPDKRGIRLLRHSDGEGPLVLRRTLPDGL
jgi:GcrA cell cycle regulator